MIKRIGLYMLALALVCSMLPIVAVAEETRVTRCDVRLREQANTKCDTLFTVPGGTELSVLGSSGGWIKTSYKGHTGYVSSDLLMELTRSGYYPLKLGDENPYVKDLQKRLFDLGYYTGSADGTFGETTFDAVKQFQKNNDMKQDGIAGGETQRALFADSAKTTSGTNTPATQNTAVETTNTSASASGETLKRNSQGKEVENLQARLGELGYYSGTADGKYGAGTEDAVRAFQKNANLTADGKAGIVTQNLLYASGAPRAKTASTTETQQTASVDTSSYATYKRGMTNKEIKDLQQKLRDLNYLEANPTGYFGSATEDAVKRFQAANNLSADGVLGPATQQMLASSSATQSAGGNTETTTDKKYGLLKEGMKSSDVTTMQKKLKALGYMKENATGYFGSATKTALIAFQKTNNLTPDGIAGSSTLSHLYDGNPVASGSSASSASSGGTNGGGESLGNGKISGPSSSSVKLYHWFTQVKPMLKSSSVLQIYDPATGYGWKLRSLSLGRHFDSEPLTSQDTLYMNAAFGGVTTWTPKTVWVKLPDGTWTLATMHNTAHLSGNIAANDFDGHLCVHFLRDMDECMKNDPNYGVQHQKAIRDAWKKLTGQVVN